MTDAQKLVAKVAAEWLGDREDIFDAYNNIESLAAEIDKALGGLTRRWGGTDPEQSDSEPFGYYEGGGPDAHYADVHNRECAESDADLYGGRVLFGWASGWVASE